MEKDEVMYEEGKTINLLDLFLTVWKFKWIFVILAIVGALCGYAKANYFTNTTYSSEITLYITNKDPTKANTGSLTYSDITAAQYMADTYAKVLKTSNFLDDVVADSGTDESIFKSISISSAEQSELLDIKITAYTENAANLLADSFIKLAPEKIQDVFSNGNAKSVNQKNAVQNGKGTLKTTAVGCAAGLIIACIIVFCLYFFDRRIHSVEETAKKYDLPLLGKVQW